MPRTVAKAVARMIAEIDFVIEFSLLPEMGAWGVTEGRSAGFWSGDQLRFTDA